ncbi:hypothetical protein MACJ_003052 [Theileria orientalis]|uniref:Uncharacterized protein n=1 Tax=Theileria orientalis TaxID=68886 RepID=A0A976M759_THEOR|nr:hypothetical protein MACJ_003052 [Theileria orientalis]
MLRIPNASPSGLVTNFETKCSQYFHPRVLVYVLRNKAAYLARNSSILNVSFKSRVLNHDETFSGTNYQMCSTQNLNIHEDLNEYRSPEPFKKLEHDLMLLSCSLISCIDYVQPQSAATIMLSLTKLNFFNEQLFSSILDSFTFESAKPKSVSLILYSLSKCAGASELVHTNFFRKVEDFVEMTVLYSSTHDLTTYLISTAKLRDNLMKNLEHDDILGTLSNVYNLILSHTLSMVDKETKLLGKEESKPAENKPAPCSFNVFELSNILESFYIMKHYNHVNHELILDQLQLKLPYSVNYINDILYIMDLFNIDPKNPAIKKLDRTSIIRSNKKFCEAILADLTDKLGLVNIYELSRLTNVINRLRLWTEDEFLKSYTNSFMSIFKSYKGVIDMELLLPIVLYYNRRYESSINREYYQSHINKRRKTEFMRDLNEISDLCGHVCDILQDYMTDNYPSKRIEDLLIFTSKLRTNRSLHRMKYNYKFNHQ